MLIKPGITADGFRTAVRDYTEPVVVEELAANAYDADATTIIVLLDSDQGFLHLIDDGVGFTAENFSEVAVLGAGNKRDIPYSKGNRHYLGSYGYGLKSTLNIASKVEINSFTNKEQLDATIDWNSLDEALKPGFEGFPCSVKSLRTKGHGTWLKLTLKNPTTKAHLDKLGDVLSNLPSDGDGFNCYYGIYGDVANSLSTAPSVFANLAVTANGLYRRGLLNRAHESTLADLHIATDTKSRTSKIQR